MLAETEGLRRASRRIASSEQCHQKRTFMPGAHAQTPSIRVPILVYHRFAATVNDSMTVRFATFEAQLRFLKERGYQVVRCETS
ncbi:hypothetical protein [Paraburkholderia xenovorans]